MEDRNLSLSAVAGTLGVSERTVRRWIQSGKLRAYKPGRDYRIPQSAVRELVEESEISPKALRRSSLEPSLLNGLEEERRESILAKAIAVAAERWEGITSEPSSDRGSASGVHLVAADLENLLSVVMGDEEVWGKLSGHERSEIATVMAALGRVTEGYQAQREEEHATEQRRAMVRQWTRELDKSA
jgi:excisionase family DNA binding protein